MNSAEAARLLALDERLRTEADHYEAVLDGGVCGIDEFRRWHAARS